jgi:hypothetical protein
MTSPTRRYPTAMVPMIAVRMKIRSRVEKEAVQGSIEDSNINK